MSTSQQCTSATTKANWILGCICWGIASRDRDEIDTLYSASVRPHLQYCAQFWFPQLKKAMDRIEKVQMRAMKLIKAGLENLTYEE